MDDGFEGRVGDDGLVKGAFFGNIFDYGEGKLVLAVFGVGVLDALGFVLGAHCCDDRMAILEQRFEDVCSDEAGSAWLILTIVF